MAAAPFGEGFGIALSVQDRFSQPLAKFATSIARSRAASQALTAGLRSSAMRMGIFAIGIAGAGYAFSKAMKPGIEFERQMREVSAVTSATSKEFTKMTNLAKKLGIETVFSAKEASGAMYMLGSRGVKTATQMEMLLQPSMDLAAALKFDLPAATELTMATLKMFGMELNQSREVVDLLTNAYKNSAANAEKLATSMQYVGPAFSSVNWELRQALPPLEMLYDLGINASMAGCYDEKTEVLTSTGFKFWPDITKEDSICTLNPKTKNIEFQKPTALIDEKYSGRMYRVKNKHVNLLVTPDHWMYVRREHRKNFERIQAKDIFGKRVEYLVAGEWEGQEEKFFILPEVKRKGYISEAGISPERRLPMDTFLEFFGYWVTEGWTVRNEKQGHYRVEMRQKDPIDRKKMLDCCQKLFKCYLKRDTIVISNKQLYEYLVKFGHATQKYLPPEFQRLSRRQLQILLEAIILGDGDKKRKRTVWTSSVKLRDNLEEIILRIGYGVSHTLTIKKGDKREIEGREITASTDGWAVNINRSQLSPHFDIKKNKQASKNDKTLERWEFYEGRIYCAVVPNHVMFIRRNGKTVWCGNTALRKSINALIKPTALGAAALRDMGLSVEQVSPELHSFTDIVRTLGEAGLTNADAITIFGQRAGPVMAKLVAEGADALLEYEEQLLATGEGSDKARKLLATYTEEVVASGAVSEFAATLLQSYKLAVVDSGYGSETAKTLLQDFKEEVEATGTTSDVAEQLLRDYEEALLDSGSAAMTAAEQLKGLPGALVLIKSSIESVWIALEELFAPALEESVRWVTEGINSFLLWSQASEKMKWGIQDFIKAYASMVKDWLKPSIVYIRDVVTNVMAAVGTWNKFSESQKAFVITGAKTGLLLTMFVSAIAILGPAIMGLAKAMAILNMGAILLNPTFWIVIAVISAIAGAVYLLYRAWTENWGGMRDELEAAWEVMGPVFEAIWEWIVKVKDWTVAKFEWTLEKAGAGWEVIKEFFINAKEWLTSKFEWMLERVGAGWEAFTEFLIKAGSWISQGFYWTLEKVGEGWDWFGGVMQWVKEKASFTFNWMLDKGYAGWTWLEEKLWPWVKEWAFNTFYWILDLAGDVYNWIKDTLIPWTTEFAEKTFDWTLNLLGDAWDKVKEIFEWPTKLWRPEIETGPLEESLGKVNEVANETKVILEKLVPEKAVENVEKLDAKWRLFTWNIEESAAVWGIYNQEMKQKIGVVAAELWLFHDEALKVAKGTPKDFALKWNAEFMRKKPSIQRAILKAIAAKDFERVLSLMGEDFADAILYGASPGGILPTLEKGERVFNIWGVDAGGMIGSGIVQGLKKEETKMEEQSKSFFDVILGSLEGMLAKLVEVLKKVPGIGPFIEEIEGIIAVFSEAKEEADALADEFIEMGKDAVGAGKKIVSAFRTISEDVALTWNYLAKFAKKKEAEMLKDWNTFTQGQLGVSHATFQELTDYWNAFSDEERALLEESYQNWTSTYNSISADAKKFYAIMEGYTGDFTEFSADEMKEIVKDWEDAGTDIKSGWAAFTIWLKNEAKDWTQIFKDTFADVTSAFKTSIIDWVKEAQTFGEFWSSFTQKLADAWLNNFVEELMKTEAIKGVLTFVTGLMGTLTDAILKAAAAAWSFAVSAIVKVITGLGSLAGALVSAVVALVSFIVATIKAIAVIVYKALAWIPIVGPALGIAAAIAAVAAIYALFAGITSAQAGMSYVPEDMPVVVHKKEAILTAPQAEEWRAGRGRAGSRTQVTYERGAIKMIVMGGINQQVDLEKAMDYLIQKQAESMVRL